MEPSHVLVPLDGSPLAEAALEHALAVYDCEVTVLNVITPLDGAMSEGGVLEPGDDRVAEARKRATEIVERAEAQAASVDREIETAVETGDPAETIVAFAQSRDVDQIVMGGHGGDRHELTRRLLGTVATKVLGETSLTVTVVR
jgi:nucleotide-binding universal stress UspA family protein